MKWLSPDPSSGMTPLTLIATMINIFVCLFVPYMTEDRFFGVFMAILIAVCVTLINFSIHELFRK